MNGIETPAEESNFHTERTRNGTGRSAGEKSWRKRWLKKPELNSGMPGARPFPACLGPHKIRNRFARSTPCPGGGMVYASDLKSVSCKGVWVRVPPRAPAIARLRRAPHGRPIFSPRGKIGSRSVAARVEARRSLSPVHPSSTDRFTGLIFARLRRHEFADMVGVAELATVTDDLGRVAPRTIVLL